ncbi:DNA repair nucleotidyltransferase/DNA polymerase [Pseudopedobacter saltans DSM 12145]|uniref:DNA repair nucleotidyltransferase/DNA polymerase n=1 Tax=Pseudopedobacter saltans (strain ATCC 51119 / DSM 12145 / JCM 21818 / CCUG 39354 / LMG 10337 / NBRC 100064 / NCIMB 13643) TaxID=762903 RepID=F0SEK3_PSESL|nr:DNA polymerase Y family protein [Pseudopedobacter saltans]ADY51893.1 DNA repair nucleotidyltransferase/DNA polymerase [Pseudopedobacter saltans DSM 12145]
MQKRYLSIWFKYLLPDALAILRPELKELPLIIVVKERGRQLVKYCNDIALKEGIKTGITVADARALVPDIILEDYEEGSERQLLKELGEWCIRFSPAVAIDGNDSLLIDLSGCSHLWNGEIPYLKDLLNRLKAKGYHVRGAIADTIGAAWAIARFGKEKAIIPAGEQYRFLLSLPPAALRLESTLIQRLHKLGMYRLESFIDLPPSVLRRRFGEDLLLRIAQALGHVEEFLDFIYIPQPYTERLPCLEPIRTAKGIELAIAQLLDALCFRLRREGMGLRQALLKCYRVDGRMVTVSIGTHKPSHHMGHLQKLLGMRIAHIEPALGIELFILEASGIEPIELSQQAIWAISSEADELLVIELLDRIAMRAGKNAIQRFLPQEHYWPERSVKSVTNLDEQPSIPWSVYRPRPTHLLACPEPIRVTAPIPDYPPILFIYKGKKHIIKKADGPERIEREWWLEAGEHRDYYTVEDEAGRRYWLFRSGHYHHQQDQWFLHGFFA